MKYNISFTLDEFKSSQKKALSTLMSEGVIVVRGGIDPSFIAPLYRAISIDANDVLSENPSSVKDVIYINAGQKGMRYRSLEKSGETTFYIRPGDDKGFLDIFNAENKYKDTLKKLNRAMKTSGFLSLIKTAFPETRQRSTNVYVTEGQESTRGYHIDCLHTKIKIFVYLTDVDIKHGPYSYIRKSHNSSVRQFNMAVNKLFNKKNTKMTVYNPFLKEVFTGRKGDVIISMQNGIHRGIPQMKESERMMLALSFR
jgi:hypothetical protein